MKRRTPWKPSQKTLLMKLLSAGSSWEVIEMMVEKDIERCRAMAAYIRSQDNYVVKPSLLERNRIEAEKRMDYTPDNLILGRGE